MSIRHNLASKLRYWDGEHYETLTNGRSIRIRTAFVEAACSILCFSFRDPTHTSSAQLSRDALALLGGAIAKTMQGGIDDDDVARAFDVVCKTLAKHVLNEDDLLFIETSTDFSVSDPWCTDEPLTHRRPVERRGEWSREVDP